MRTPKRNASGSVAMMLPGEGRVELEVNHEGTLLALRVVSVGGARALVMFTPAQAKQFREKYWHAQLVRGMRFAGWRI